MVEFSGRVFGSDLMLAMNEFVMLTYRQPGLPHWQPSFEGHSAFFSPMLACGITSSVGQIPSEVLATDLVLRLHPKNSSQILI